MEGSLRIDLGTALPALPPPPPDGVAHNFGTVSCELPDNVHPLRPPLWLGGVVAHHDSAEASKQIGMHILYKWPARLGGWMVGKVTAVNVEEAESIAGKKCNYEVHYDADGETAYHLLSIEKYAVNAKAAVDSWALLG
ncbi:hypothetical protein AB1Y20_004275 [Prymnesium parvum]|uniref:Gamma-glutamylcyclotransferase n=1 Tax=Prymnesium parvum TaxID=97485 RepID=A0AB34J9J1_PRYPA|mmetsp:Transcript_9227/g.13870  ORF Transcript_9227/g.13870 Transcript_9227/m.13870 type:complete len:138 (+) Transcript_9227:153-566(+)